jgi:hypothetical protein
MIDTHETFESLTAVHFSREQASALTTALKKSEGDLLTKDHLDLRLKAELAPIRAEMAHTTWLIRGLYLIAVGQLVATWYIGKH